MGRTVELIDGIQKRLDNIQTEATRLLVFANSTFDAALGPRSYFGMPRRLRAD
jgi:hypothetical protein